jgi:hypothetical protein
VTALLGVEISHSLCGLLHSLIIPIKLSLPIYRPFQALLLFIKLPLPYYKPSYKPSPISAKPPKLSLARVASL